MIDSLVALLISLVLAEAPVLAIPDAAEDLARYRAGVAHLARLDIEAGAAGALVSPDVDPVVLATIQWYESRLRPDVEDGDCYLLRSWAGLRRVCRAVGPMQLTTSARSFLLAVDGETWRGRDIDLRDPATSVEAGYRALVFYRGFCPGPPWRQLAAYGMGRCPGRHSAPGFEARRRCYLLTALLRHLGRLPADWRCGHEGLAVEEHTRRLVAKLGAG